MRDRRRKVAVDLRSKISTCGVRKRKRCDLFKCLRKKSELFDLGRRCKEERGVRSMKGAVNFDCPQRLGGF